MYVFFCQAEGGIRDLVRSRGLGDVYKRQQLIIPTPPVATPALMIPDAQGQLVTDPVSDVVPTIDPAIEALILEASQQQLIAYVRQLESFGTRNAFSDTQSETFGIGAARRWIFNELSLIHISEPTRPY